MGQRAQRILIVEDQTIFRELLAQVLQSGASYDIVEVCCGRDALDACARVTPDLVILDAVLPDINGLDVLKELSTMRPRLPVLMVTGHARPVLVQQAVKDGARGFVTKSTPLKELQEAVRLLLGGGRYFCTSTSSLMADAIRSPTNPALTRRQREIVQLVAQGRSSKEIANELGISLKTVSNHRHQIRERLDLSDVASFTRYAVEQGLVEPKV